MDTYPQKSKSPLLDQNLLSKNTSECEAILKKTEANFWPSETIEDKLIYQKPAFQKAQQKKQNHFGAFILPGKYDLRFDTAANALALLQFQLKDSQKDAQNSDLAPFFGDLRQSEKLSKITFNKTTTEHSMAMGNLNKSKETTQTATTALKVAT